MAPKHHPTPLSGGDRKALGKELGNPKPMITLRPNCVRSPSKRAKQPQTSWTES
ncbi:hypothetical protein GTH44_39285 [Bradyrhizobium japonicum]|nr:hypothetical protein [Bradyrhizobium japonicum]